MAAGATFFHLPLSRSLFVFCSLSLNPPRTPPPNQNEMADISYAGQASIGWNWGVLGGVAGTQR